MRSGGSSAFEPVDQLLQPLDVGRVIAAFVTRPAIRDDGIGEARAEGEQILLDRLEGSGDAWIDAGRTRPHRDRH